jgi:hypothetical protein
MAMCVVRVVKMPGRGNVRSKSDQNAWTWLIGSSKRSKCLDVADRQ